MHANSRSIEVPTRLVEKALLIITLDKIWTVENSTWLIFQFQFSKFFFYTNFTFRMKVAKIAGEVQLDHLP